MLQLAVDPKLGFADFQWGVALCKWTKWKHFACFSSCLDNSSNCEHCSLTSQLQTCVSKSKQLKACSARATFTTITFRLHVCWFNQTALSSKKKASVLNNISKPHLYRIKYACVVSFASQYIPTFLLFFSPVAWQPIWTFYCQRWVFKM